MIRRPLNPRFEDAVLTGRKITTIRDKAWPVGRTIMLFRWLGTPYRSKQTDIAAVVVWQTEPIEITSAPGGMVYSSPWIEKKSIWKTEGFSSPSQMDDWFRPLVKSGETVTKILMRFRLATPAEVAAATEQSPQPKHT